MSSMQRNALFNKFLIGKPQPCIVLLQAESSVIVVLKMLKTFGSIQLV